MIFIDSLVECHVEYTGTSSIRLFFVPGEIHLVIGKTVLKGDRFSTKWENKALKNDHTR